MSAADTDDVKGSPKWTGNTVSPELLTSSPGSDGPESDEGLSQLPVRKVQSSVRLFGEDIGERDFEDSATYSDDDPGATTPPLLLDVADQNEEEPAAANAAVPNNFAPEVQGRRPPRAPTNAHSNPAMGTTSDAAQDRRRSAGRASAGDFSFVSAMSDVSDEDGLVLKRRERLVSWGDDHSFGGKPVPNTSRILEGMNSPPQAKQVNKKLTMAEIVNPMESEAETHILRSLEQRDKSSRMVIENTLLFPNLPDDASLQKLMLSPAPSADQSSHDEKIPLTPTSGSGSRTSIASRHSSSRRSEGRSTRRSTGHKRTSTSASRHSAGSEGADTTLFGLATMMHKIHLEANKEHTDKVNHEHLADHRNAISGLGQPATNSAEQPRTDTDQLVAHAAQMFRRKVKKEDKASVGTFLDSDGDTEKHDNIDNEGGNNGDTEGYDIELGLDTDDGGRKKGKKSWFGRFGRKGHGKDFLGSKSKQAYHRTIGVAKEDWDQFNDFLEVRKKSTIVFAKNVLVYLFLPVLGISALLYYALGNPLSASGASISWLLLFFGIRQVITFSFAKITVLFIIDFLALKTRFLLKILGPMLTLIIVQSKGWPCTLFWWAVYDLCMLSGENAFAHHWMFYQSWIGLFNASNPNGNITENIWNYRILVAALIIGLVVAIKRFAVGLYLGGRTYTNYGTKLTNVILRMIMISQVAALARKFEAEYDPDVSASGSKPRDAFKWDYRGFGDDAGVSDGDEDGQRRPRMMSVDDPLINGKSRSRDPLTRSLNASDRFRITELLGRWEEPQEERNLGKVSIQAILQFKQTLAFMDLTYPFSSAFGLANNRESCIQSAQSIFGCLLKGNPPPAGADEASVLKFETLAELARDETEMDESKLKDIVRVFRPDRDGNLSMLDFVKSVDLVYKELRLLRASIQNSSQIDKAFEAIINVAFYFLLGCIMLASWGIDPLALFVSLSSVIVAFSFAVGASSAKYFEGLMFILGRSPYDIGDRISINQADETPKVDGEATWFVENVSLYFTTLRFGATNEVATVANFNLANARIINAARSKRALVYVNLKFGIETPYAKTQVFKDTMEAFVKQRPREWLNCSGIRVTRVMADLGFIEYVIILQHRESWQQIGVILQSKAEVMNYSLEVQKKLRIKYEQPSTPVDLTVNNPGSLQSLLMPSTEGGMMAPSPDRSASERARHGRMASQDLRNIAAMFATQDEESTQ